MEGQGLLAVKATGIHDQVQLLMIRDLENQLAGGILIRHHIEADGESLLEQLRQKLGKIPAFGDDFNLIGRKTIAVEQNSEALRQGAALLLRENSANFVFGAAGK